MVIDELVKPKDKPEQKFEKVEFNIDDDISQLVPPTFSTVSKGPPQPMLELSWNHKYTPIGEKLPSPNVHMCIGCKKPIRMYGRLVRIFMLSYISTIRPNQMIVVIFVPICNLDFLQACILLLVCTKTRRLLFMLF